MTKIRSKDKKLGGSKLVAQTTKRVLTFLISLLGVFDLVLIFKLGEFIWPTWMIDYRAPIMGLALFSTFVLIAVSPVIIEANSNPRHLSGPGKDPRQGWGP